jgi:hypothetical protein
MWGPAHINSPDIGARHKDCSACEAAVPFDLQRAGAKVARFLLSSSASQASGTIQTAKAVIQEVMDNL